MSGGAAPFLKLKAFPLSVAVWRNEGKDGKHEWFSIKLTKSYKDDEGKWCETTNLTDRDLPAAALLLQTTWDRLGVTDESRRGQVSQAEDRSF